MIESQVMAAVRGAILIFLAVSATEIGLGALFVNMKEAHIIRSILAEVYYPQPPTRIHIDNTMDFVIVHIITRRQRSCSI